MTKVSLVALILGAALFPLAACQPAEQAGTPAQSAGQAPGTPGQPNANAVFVNRAGMSGLEEVRFAQVAETKATDPAVRRVAEKIIADLTAVNQQLAALAESKGMAPPSDVGGRNEMLYQQLQSLSGPAFDRAYTGGELQDMTMVTETFQSEADSGSDPQVRSFAQQYVPMMLEHVRMMGTVAGP
jgi:putative membrane protein